MMKISRVNNTYNRANFKAALPAGKLQEATSKYFSKFEQVGEGVNIALDFIGKALLVPTVIMLASKEDKEKKSYSAMKNPIGATASLVIEAPLLMVGSKYIGKLANSGKLDASNSDFSYNEKAATDSFMKSAKEMAEKDLTFKENSKELLEKVKNSGFSNNMKDDFDDIITKFDKEKLSGVVESFKKMELSHKRLYHLQNRLCFAAALLLTPVICGFENFMLPRVMKLFGKNKEASAKVGADENVKVGSNKGAEVGADKNVKVGTNKSDLLSEKLNIQAPWENSKSKEIKCPA